MDFWFTSMFTSRLWKKDEIELFKDIGQRLSDALTSSLIFKEMNKSEARFRALIENTTDLTVIFDENSVFKYINKSQVDFGYDVNDLIGRTFFEFIQPQDLPY